LSDANKLLIRCAWKGNSAFDFEYGPCWAPGECFVLPPCTGTRRSRTCDLNPKGKYQYPHSMAPIFAGFSINGSLSYVTDVFVDFTSTAFKHDPDGTTNVTYFFESTGCTYPPTFTPRPVKYTADGYPIKPPSCDRQTGGKVLRSEADGKAMINFGRFNDSYYGVGKGSLFIPVQRPNVSNIFEFHWCPDQNEFQVTVFKKWGPYPFRPQSPEVETLEAEKAFMQASMQKEIDQLQADNIQLQASNTQCADDKSELQTGTVKVVFV